jgi:hypothetical protein
MAIGQGHRIQTLQISGKKHWFSRRMSNRFSNRDRSAEYNRRGLVCDNCSGVSSRRRCPTLSQPLVAQWPEKRAQLARTYSVGLQ